MRTQLVAAIISPAYVAVSGHLFRQVFGGESIHIGGIVVGCISWFIVLICLDPKNNTSDLGPPG